MSISNTLSNVSAWYESLNFSYAYNKLSNTSQDAVSVMEQRYKIMPGTGEQLGTFTFSGYEFSVLGVSLMALTVFCVLIVPLLCAYYFGFRKFKTLTFKGKIGHTNYLLFTAFLFSSAIIAAINYIYHPVKDHYVVWSMVHMGVGLPLFCFIFNAIVAESKKGIEFMGVDYQPKILICLCIVLLPIGWMISGSMLDHLFLKGESYIFTILFFILFLFSAKFSYTRTIPPKIMKKDVDLIKVITIDNKDDGQNSQNIYDDVLRMAKKLSFKDCVVYVVDCKDKKIVECFNPDYFDSKKAKTLSIVISLDLMFSKDQEQRDEEIAREIARIVSPMNQKIRIIRTFMSNNFFFAYFNTIGDFNDSSPTVKVDVYERTLMGDRKIDSYTRPDNGVLLTIPFMILGLIAIVFSLVIGAVMQIFTAIFTFDYNDAVVKKILEDE